MKNDIKKILVALGSFKDVFSPRQSRNLIEKIIAKSNSNFEVTSINLADGGEYSHEIVKENFICKEVFVRNVISPHKTKINSSYLLLDSDTAFISSSRILRIKPNLDKYKNPLNLTSYGLGQLIKHSIKKSKVKLIYIALGGTNTVDGGVGMLQALDVEFLGMDQSKLAPLDRKYFSGCDLKYIEQIKNYNQLDHLKKIQVISLCDGDINISEMFTPNNQKISNLYNVNRKYINEELIIGIKKFSAVVANLFDIEKIEKKCFFGAAGGINLSLKCFFPLKIQFGVDFFIDKLNIKKLIMNTDLVITGEGRYDNSLSGKTPVGICRLAKKYNKKVIYLSGDVNEELKCYFNDNVAYELPLELLKNGISTMISCHNLNEAIPTHFMDINALKKILRKNTKKVFEQSLSAPLMKKVLD